MNIVYTSLSCERGTVDCCMLYVWSDAAAPEVHYATVDMYPSKGMRVTGQVGSVLLAQLTATAAKTNKDDRGW